MPPKDYAQLLYDVFKNKPEEQQGQILKRFKSILMRNKDAHLISAITKELEKIQKQTEQGRITYISSSSKLSGNHRQELESAFPEPREFSVNPDLLGGIAVRHDDRVYNATLRKKMELLKSSI